MATIQSSIQLQDRMSAVLNNITQSMSIMLNTFEATQASADRGINGAMMDSARSGIAQASAALMQYQEELARTATLNVPPPVREADTWIPVNSQPTFTNSGSERFALEYQEANQMAQRLYNTQQQISLRARNLNVTPPGMLSDVTAVENRIQMLASRIGDLNSIPVELRTTRVNNELEGMRERLTQITSIQSDLNGAMSRMDVGAINTEYQRLNTAVGAVERNIRDNSIAQSQFNQSIREGSNAASGLGNKLKGVAMGVAAAFSAQKVIALADSTTQTTARLNLMNDGLQSTEELNQMIFASAQRARAPYMDTAGAIAKMGINAGNAFNSNGELIAFMEQVNKQFVIGGASAQEQSNAMMQLSQAMASGALRGEELNSILDAAPGIARTIEQSMGWAEGSIKQYAEKGKVSAQVVKNSLLNMADETNEKFNSMPMTFGQMLTAVQTTLLQTFLPVIQIIGKGASFINENWSTIAPIFTGIAAGIAVAALAWGVYTAWQWIATGAAWSFVMANQALITGLLSNPFLWIAIVIGVVVAAIYKWVQSVGGLRIAWLICVNAVKTYLDDLKIGFMVAWSAIQAGINNMIYGFDSFRVGVLNSIGNLKVKGLSLLQDFINGAIDRVNAFIAAINSIASTSIELVAHVEFAADAAIEEKVKQSQRAAELAARSSANEAAKKANEKQIYESHRQADRARMQRQADIAKARNDSAAKAAANDSTYGGAEPEIATNTGNTAGNTGNTAGNTARMADSMEMAEEDLKYLRDAAEQEVVNRFTTAALTVNMGGITNQVNSQMDLDGINSYLETSIFEVLETAAEGVY